MTNPEQRQRLMAGCLSAFFQSCTGTRPEFDDKFPVLETGSFKKASADAGFVSFLHRLFLALPELGRHERLDPRALQQSAVASMSWLSGALLLEERWLASQTPQALRATSGGRAVVVQVSEDCDVNVMMSLAQLHGLLRLITETDMRSAALSRLNAEAQKADDNAGANAAVLKEVYSVLAVAAQKGDEESLQAVYSTLFSLLDGGEETEEETAGAGWWADEAAPWQAALLEENYLEVLDRLSLSVKCRHL